LEACSACWITESSCADDGPSRLAASATTAGRGVPWDADGAARACGARQNAVATPANAGAATIGSRRAIRVRECFLWQPKGLLSVQVALTEKAAQRAGSLRSA